MDLQATPRVAVLGAGISGLAAALRLREAKPPVEFTLFEAANKPGGVLRTERAEGFLVEHAADMFTTAEPAAVELCRRLGFEEQLLATDEARRRAFIVRRGRLHPVPEGFSLMVPRRAWPLAFSGLLSPGGKLRMAREYFLPARREETDESLADFARRRFGGEAFERLIQPLVGGIYTADPERLSMAATLPQFLAMERKHGSLLRAVWRERAKAREAEQNASGARYGLFLTPREGMSSWVDTVSAHLGGGLRTGCRVERIRRIAGEPDGEQAAGSSLGGRGPHPAWRLEWRDPDGRSREAVFNAVILALPAHRSAELLGESAPLLAERLAEIEYASAAVVVGGYRLREIAHPLDGFGFVVPATERRRILACSFASRKFPGRAPAECVLLRTFVGGALQPELLERDDAELAQLVAEELRELIGLRGAPLLSRVIRWDRAMPQYHVGHLDRVAEIERLAAELPGMELAGNSLRGVGIPQCIRGGERAADRVLQELLPALGFAEGS